jgi:Icc-related predicted phosphoesterase
MKLLLFSDLHANAAAAQRLVGRARDVDVLVGAGDFANLRRTLSVCIDVLRQVKKPAVLVAGNHESAEELREECRHWPQAQVLQGSGTIIDGIAFFGIGGGVPVTPFGPWSYDFTEEQAAELLSRCSNARVLVSHSPPRGLVDRSSRGQSLGSLAVSDAVVRLQPALVVCGHIHESAGEQARLGSSVVVNAGPGGIIWDLDTGPSPASHGEREHGRA